MNVQDRQTLINEMAAERTALLEEARITKILMDQVRCEAKEAASRIKGAKLKGAKILSIKISQEEEDRYQVLFNHALFHLSGEDLDEMNAAFPIIKSAGYGVEPKELGESPKEDLVASYEITM